MAGIHPVSEKFPNVQRDINLCVYPIKGSELAPLTTGNIVDFKWNILGVRNFSGADLVINFKPVGRDIYFEYTIPDGEVMYDISFEKIDITGTTSASYNDPKVYYLYM